jgi:FMN reductase
VSVRTAIVVGNPKAHSRTRRVAEALVDAIDESLGEAAGDRAGRVVVDLADVAGELFDPSSATVRELLEAVSSSDLVIVASPTYKATYTGLLKAFLDRYANGALRGVVAVAVMTGAAPIHALAPEVSLRPLLVELGASLPTRGLYVTEDQFDDLHRVIGAWSDAALPPLRRALGLS